MSPSDLAGKQLSEAEAEQTHGVINVYLQPIVASRCNTRLNSYSRAIRDLKKEAVLGPVKTFLILKDTSRNTRGWIFQGCMRRKSEVLTDRDFCILGVAAKKYVLVLASIIFAQIRRFKTSSLIMKGGKLGYSVYRGWKIQTALRIWSLCSVG